MSKHICEPERSTPDHVRRHFLLTVMCAALFAAILNTPLSADEIYFKTGYSRTAVVIRETEDSITFKTEMGISTIGRDKVDFVEEATREENHLLLKKWRQKELEIKEAQEAKHAAEKRFEDAQRAKGLVNFEGKWMTPEEKEDLLNIRRRAREHRRQFEIDQKAKGLVKFQHIWVTPEQAKELGEMAPEIYRLYEEITSQRRMSGSLRSGMANATSIEEADEFTKRIEAINKKIAESTEKLGKLLERADEIEATSVRYETPDEFRGALGPETESD
jgi:hypothetical protein